LFVAQHHSRNVLIMYFQLKNHVWGNICNFVGVNGLDRDAMRARYMLCVRPSDRLSQFCIVPKRLNVRKHCFGRIITVSQATCNTPRPPLIGTGYYPHHSTNHDSLLMTTSHSAQVISAKRGIKGCADK